MGSQMAGQQRMTKAERRAAAQAAMAKAAAVKRRSQVISWSVAGVVAVGLIAAAILVFSGMENGDDKDVALRRRRARSQLPASAVAGRSGSGTWHQTEGGPLVPAS